jgi:hypothetical protein
LGCKTFDFLLKGVALDRLNLLWKPYFGGKKIEEVIASLEFTLYSLHICTVHVNKASVDFEIRES